MQHFFLPQLQTITTLDGVHDIVVPILSSIRHGEGVDRLGFVSGVISSDGSEYEVRNLKRLSEHTERLRTAHDFPIVSATDIFDHALINRIASPSEAFIPFWRRVLGCGHVTDIFMTPRWKESIGAQDEHVYAQEIGLTIHYVDNI